MITFAVKCKACGAILEVELSNINSTNNLLLFGGSCHCMYEKAEAEGYTKGYKEGYSKRTKQCHC